MKQLETVKLTCVAGCKSIKVRFMFTSRSPLSEEKKIDQLYFIDVRATLISF